MSATLNVDKFKSYFKPFGEHYGQFQAPIPHVDIPQTSYPVAVKYLDDIVQCLQLKKRDVVNLATGPFEAPGMSESRRRLLVTWLYVKHLSAPKKDAFLVFLPGISLIDEIVCALGFFTF
jgi:HrpA-like RNA helicase